MNVGQFFPYLKKRIRSFLRIPWPENVSNEEVMRKIETKGTLRIKKLQS